MNADTYLKHWEGRKVWTHLKNKKHQRRLALCASMAEGPEVVEIGCAFGHSTRIMAGFRPGRWVGLDFSARAVEKAAELFPEEEWIFAESASDLSAIEGRFDSAVATEIIEHVENDEAFARAVLRVPRSRAVFTTPSSKVSDPGHLRLYSRADLERLFSVGRFPWITRTTISEDGPFFFVVVDVDREALVLYDRGGVGGRIGG